MTFVEIGIHLHSTSHKLSCSAACPLIQNDRIIQCFFCQVQETLIGHLCAEYTYSHSISIYGKHKCVHAQIFQQFKYSNSFSLQGSLTQNSQLLETLPCVKVSKSVYKQTQQTAQSSHSKSIYTSLKGSHSGTHPNLFLLIVDTIWENLLI